MTSLWVRCLILLLVAFASLGHLATARAEVTTPRELAAELKRTGDLAMDEIRYEDAIAAYTRAYAAFPEPAVLYNRARAHQARGELAAAARDLRRFRETADAETRERVPGLEELIAEVEAKVGRVVVECPVSGAAVEIAGQRVGRTPLAEGIEVTAGSVSVEVTAPGWLPYRAKVEVPGGSERRIFARLEPIVTEAMLSIRASPADAVYVDGKRVGGPPVDVSVSPGRHRVVARAERHRDADATVVVAAGERRELTLEPERIPLLVERWWFWTTAGVLAAATVTTLALTLERSAADGEHFAPGTIQGPLVIRFGPGVR